MSGTRINWSELRERTRLAERAVLEAGTVSPEQRRRVLDQRARLLAAQAQPEYRPEADLSVLVVRCGAGRYALPLSEAVEVIREPVLAAVPHAPAHVAGLIQVRGEIRPVYHLTVLLGHPASAPATPPVVVLARSAGRELGIGVEAVEDIRVTGADKRLPMAATPGHAGWMTEDLIPCLAVNTLIPEQN